MAELQLGGKTIATQTGNEEAIMHSSLLRVAARSQPNTPVKGDIYLDSTDNKLKIHNGTAFINMVSEPASGGIVTTYTLSGVTYQVHTFLQSQSFILLIDKTVDILLVAGGGGGGRYSANGVGGGGAGGMVVGSNISILHGLYAINIGGGGAGYTSNTNGGKGSDSTIVLGSVDTVTAKGGGAGYYDNGSGHTNYANGGSAGGGGNNTTHNGVGTQDNQTLNSQTLTGHGNGSAAPANGGYGAGGGGAGGAGGNAAVTPQLGGVGLANNFRTGSNITYAAGGDSAGSTFRNGPANTGDGGTGGYATSGQGGSGICVIRYQI